jgi:hypothetical protein
MSVRACHYSLRNNPVFGYFSAEAYNHVENHLRSMVSMLHSPVLLMNTIEMKKSKEQWWNDNDRVKPK